MSPSVTSTLVVLGALATACGGGEHLDGGSGNGASSAGGRGGTGGTSESMTCIPGSTEVCSGTTGCRGGRTCRVDGSGWSACDCGTGGAVGAGPNNGNGGTGAGGTTAAGGAATGGGSAGTLAATPTCAASCSSPADCGAGTPTDDADNYRCESGVCVPIGCNSDAECSNQTPGTLCRSVTGAARPACTRACSVPDDCTTVSPAYDADNFHCVEGACEYTGCNDDADCEGIFPGMNPACADVGTAIPTCVPRCETSEDCSLGPALADADNYRCDDGLCIYLGCRSDAECAPTLDMCLGL